MKDNVHYLLQPKAVKVLTHLHPPSSSSSSGLACFLWFVGFCFLANQWQATSPDELPLAQGSDAARATIAFCFFSIVTWVCVFIPVYTHCVCVLYFQGYRCLVTEAAACHPLCSLTHTHTHTPVLPHDLRHIQKFYEVS